MDAGPPPSRATTNPVAKYCVSKAAVASVQAAARHEMSDLVSRQSALRNRLRAAMVEHGVVLATTTTTTPSSDTSTSSSPPCYVVLRPPPRRAPTCDDVVAALHWLVNHPPPAPPPRRRNPKDATPAATAERWLDDVIKELGRHLRSDAASAQVDKPPNLLVTPHRPKAAGPPSVDGLAFATPVASASADPAVRGLVARLAGEFAAASIALKAERQAWRDKAAPQRAVCEAAEEGALRALQAMHGEAQRVTMRRKAPPPPSSSSSASPPAASSSSSPPPPSSTTYELRCRTATRTPRVGVRDLLAQVRRLVLEATRLDDASSSPPALEWTSSLASAVERGLRAWHEEASAPVETSKVAIHKVRDDTALPAALAAADVPSSASSSSVRR